MGKVIVAKGKAFWLLLSIFLLCVFQHFSISEFPPTHLCERRNKLSGNNFFMFIFCLYLPPIFCAVLPFYEFVVRLVCQARFIVGLK